MRAVVTRCSAASVEVAGEIVGQLPQPGLLVLLGITHDDDEATAQKVVRKLAGLRILEGERSVLDESAPVLVVSQFTLYGDVRKGRRPSWSAAAGREQSEPLVEHFCKLLREAGLRVETGVFGAMMRVHSVNEGPFTVVIDSADLA